MNAETDQSKPMSNELNKYGDPPTLNYDENSEYNDDTLDSKMSNDSNIDFGEPLGSIHLLQYRSNLMPLTEIKCN